MNTKKISFEDTSIAFSSKHNAALRKANLIFSLINKPWISTFGTHVIGYALKFGFPIDGLIKKTIFDHFCGGESIDKSEPTIQQLERYGIGTILDYSVEGEDSEEDYDNTLNEILLTIEKAKNSSTIPFSVFKVTGLASARLLEKIQNKDSLDDAEIMNWEKAKNRVDTICSSAYYANIPILIDAEETWLQQPIDALTDLMMAKYNQQKTIVFNTYQLYTIDGFLKLQLAYRNARANNYFLGAKLVRGAYMEKEKERAVKMNYQNPVHPTKNDTDKAFNQALDFCINNLQHLSLVCGSHNEFSNQYLIELMAKNNVRENDNRVWFAQLYGMSDNISFNLAIAGYNVAKYVPYGPVKSVMPYLFRRAAENTSVAGQSSRELTLIRKEMKRRKMQLII